MSKSIQIKRRLSASEFRSLRKEIMRRYGRPLNLLIVDACELADLVDFGQQTKEQLFKHLDEESNP